jgi:hypothetical protein
MGIVGRQLKWGFRLGLAVWLLTIGAVLYYSDKNLGGGSAESKEGTTPDLFGRTGLDAP